MEALKPWRQELDLFGNRVLGRSSVYLQQKECSSGECNLGNFYTDSMLHAFLESQSYDSPNWSNITVALTTQGNFRVPLQPGDLTYNHLITMCPWENDLYALTLKGAIIKELLEDSVATITKNKTTSSRFLQVSGLKILYNITEPIGHRIKELRIRCQNCTVPEYVEFDLNMNYQLVVMEYLANGKNGFNLIKDNAKDLRRGPGDLEALIKFLEIHDPVVAAIEGRIKIVN